MQILVYILTVILAIDCLALIGCVLLQQSKSTGLGTLGGGAETLLGKHRSKGYEARLVSITKVTATIFMGLTVIIALIVRYAKL